MDFQKQMDFQEQCIKNQLKNIIERDGRKVEVLTTLLCEPEIDGSERCFYETCAFPVNESSNVIDRCRPEDNYKAMHKKSCRKIRRLLRQGKKI